jgi:AcrR family transcriptional regulator
MAAVTFDAIAERSGEPSSATTYYFGEKRNLIVAMHGTVLARAQRTTLRYLRAASKSDGHPLAAPPLADAPVLRSLRSLYEMFPEIVRDDELLARHAEFVAWLRSAVSASCRARGAPWSPALVDLTLAVAYGLPIQLLIDADALDPGPVLVMWASLVAAYGSGTSVRSEGRRVSP